jgi:hypothetical protein
MQGGNEWGSLSQGVDQFRGRGPRGYRRSDDRIREEVCDCLTDDDHLDASNIEVMVKDGEVQLTGMVSSRNDKRWAESLAERISGVKEVQNSLRVQDQQRGAQGSQEQSGQGQGMQSQSGQSSAQASTTQTGKDKGKEKDNLPH